MIKSPRWWHLILMGPWQVGRLIGLLDGCVVLHAKIIAPSTTEGELFDLLFVCWLVVVEVPS